MFDFMSMASKSTRTYPLASKHDTLLGSKSVKVVSAYRMAIHGDAPARDPSQLNLFLAYPVVAIANTRLLWVLVLITDVVKTPDLLVDHLALLVDELVGLGRGLPAQIESLNC